MFISWSGDKSRGVALALSDWLPAVINSVEPFVSSDISAGTRWQTELAAQLEATSFGIICVTRQNQLAPWLNFEAGALAKAVDSSRVVPLAIDLSPSDVKPPLGQFQAQPATEAGIRKIVESVNSASTDPPLSEARLDKSLTKWWPDLATTLQEVEKASAAGPGLPDRSERELLEEILNTVRGLARPPTLPAVPTLQEIANLPVGQRSETRSSAGASSWHLTLPVSGSTSATGFPRGETRLLVAA